MVTKKLNTIISHTLQLSEFCFKTKFLILFFIFGIINWKFIPVFRFSNEILNHIFIIITLSIPLLFLIKQIKIKNTINILFILPIAFISSVLSFIVFLNIIFILKDGYNAAFQEISKHQINHNNISIYRTNGGATTDYWITVRQEKYILPGLLLIKNLYSQYHIYDTQYQIIEPNILYLFPENTKETFKYEIKRFVYF